MKTFLLILFKSIELSVFIFISIQLYKIPFNKITWYILAGISFIYLVLTYKINKELISDWIKLNKKLINKILKNKNYE